MNDTQVSLVQNSFALVEPIADQAAQLFYGRLFEIAPHVEALFTGDMNEQGRKLMSTLGVVVRGLDEFDQLLPVAANLARRHVDYGVEPEHYDDVGAALLWTLSTGLGDEFTPAVEEAWTTAYTALAGAMVAAGYPSTS